MRIMAIENVKPGLVVGRTIFGFPSQNLLNAGTVLTDEYIARLKELGVMSLYVTDEYTEDIEVDDIVCDQTRLEAGQLTKEIMEKTRLGKGIDSRQVKQVINKIIEDLLENKELLIKLIDIRSLHDHTYFHSVNVAILSGVVGIKLGFSYPKLQELMIGALFHDIGKTVLSVEVGDRTDTSEKVDITRMMRKHPLLGFEILKNNKSLSVLSAHVALQHHERFDGQGYPRNLSGSEIHQFARIVSITNTYDHLTTDAPGKPRVPSHQAIEYLMVNAGYAFDQELINTFIQCIALYPEGTLVKLNTGETAIIVKSYYGFPTRPRIKIVSNADGSKPQIPQTIELYKTPTYFILEVIDN